MNRSKENSQVRPSSAPPVRFWPQVAGLVLVAISYWGAVRLGLLVVAQPEGVASIWPASGLALAVLVLSPKRQWTKLLAVIFVTNAAGNLSGGNTLLVSLGFALANMFEALLGAWVLIYFCRSTITFGRILEIFVLFGVAIISNGFTALLGASVSALAFGAPFTHTWLVWWTSDGLGMLLVTPLIVTWATSRNMFQTASPRRIMEAVLLTVIMALFAWLLFGNFTLAEEPVLRNYMLFPFLIWLAFRYSPRGMATALTLLAAIAIWNTLQGYGIFGFANQTVTEHLVSVQMLLIVLAFTGLLLSAIVTERKRAEEDLIESEDKFKYIFDYSAAGKSITLPSGEINANHAFCEMLGYSPDELKSSKWQEISHPDDLELTQNAVNSLLSAEKESVRFIKRYIHKDGSVVWTDVGTSLRRDRDGQPLYFMTTILDITERKQAEDALRQSEEKFSTAFLTSPYAITITRLEDGRFIEVNPAFTSLTGYTQEQALAGTSIELNLWVNLEERQRVLAALGAGQPVVDQEFLFRKKDGEVLTGLFSAQAIQLSHGPCILSSINDITARKQAEETLKEYNTRLESDVETRTRELRAAQEQLIRHEKLAVLGQLAGGVGHELRNPLAVINNAVYYLKLVQPDANEKIKQYHGMIERETHNAEKIITDLLDFARIKSVERESLAVPELVQRVLDRFPASPSVEVVLELPATLPMVYADQRQVEQVLGNLTVNACQAMPDGGRLTISARQQKDLLAITVQDTGVGITPENINKIFEPLFTTKSKGIGLGLAVSQKLAEANGGRIEVQSEPGQGSTFTLYLPVSS